MHGVKILENLFNYPSRKGIAKKFGIQYSIISADSLVSQM